MMPTVQSTRHHRSRGPYPAFLDLRGRLCVVVGGGRIAAQKVQALRRGGARIRLISPTLVQPLQRLAKSGAMEHRARPFQTRDVQGAWLVISATNDHAVDEAVWRTATARRMFVNAVDRPELCSFIVPSILRRGAVTIAVSTGGSSPSLAKWIRRRLETAVGEEYGELAGLLRGLRANAKRRLPDYASRKRYFDQLIKPRMVQLMKTGQRLTAKREALALLDRHAERALS